jgi:hypothetical protein
MATMSQQNSGAISMISDATQLAALDLAIEIATGRRKLNAAESELFRRHIDAIRGRIIDAAANTAVRDAARRDTKTEGARG